MRDKGITLGKAAKKYGLVKMTLMRYANEGKVVTLEMPDGHGKARILDEKSVKDLVQGNGGLRKESRKRSVYGGRDEVQELDSIETARQYMRHCKNSGYQDSVYKQTERVVMAYAYGYDVIQYRGEAVQEYIAGMDVGQNTKKLYYGYIRTFYNWIEQTYGVRTPLRKGMSPKVKKMMPRALDESEVEKLFGVIEDHQDKVMVNTFLSTGIRRGELCNLDVEDIYRSHMHIKGIEGNKSGEGDVPITEQLSEQLLGMSDDGHVFSGKDGKRLTGNAVSLRMIKYMEKAGIKGKRRGSHTLRHTAACNLLERTGDLDFVRQILRHTDVSMTLVYAQLRPKSVENKYQAVMKSGGIRLMEV